MTTVCRRAGVHAYVEPTSAPRLHLLRVDLTCVPTGDALDALVVDLSTFAQDHDERYVLHIRHVDSDTLQPPNLAELLALVGRLLDLKHLVDTKFRGTLVQGRHVDDVVRTAKNLFLGLYQPRRPFDIVASDAEAAAFVDAILARHQGTSSTLRGDVGGPT